MNNKGDMSQAFSDVNTKKTFLCEKTFMYKREKCFREFCVKRYMKILQ